MHIVLLSNFVAIGIVTYIVLLGDFVVVRMTVYLVVLSGYVPGCTECLC